MTKKRVYTEEQKARNKITRAIRHKANPDYKRIYTDEQKARRKITKARWLKKNPDYKKEYYKEWNEKHNLGYWVVYVLYNYDGLGNDYAGQTGNIYQRMSKHRTRGNNTENFEVIEKFDCYYEALAFELTMHCDGCHGGK